MEICRGHYKALACMSDAVALIDMIHGFADCVASSRKMWCRPKVAEVNASLAIREGRYAIEIENHVESGVGCAFVANDVFAGPLSNFTLVTGINGGGKSTYLKQVSERASLMPPTIHQIHPSNKLIIKSADRTHCDSSSVRRVRARGGSLHPHQASERSERALRKC